MNLDDMIKYLIWIFFFAIALSGLYFMLKKFGVI
jgi:hypothetical protein